jgi:hypothetical protein
VGIGLGCSQQGYSTLPPKTRVDLQTKQIEGAKFSNMHRGKALVMDRSGMPFSSLKRIDSARKTRPPLPGKR